MERFLSGQTSCDAANSPALGKPPCSPLIGAKSGWEPPCLDLLDEPEDSLGSQEDKDKSVGSKGIAIDACVHPAGHAPVEDLAYSSTRKLGHSHPKQGIATLGVYLAELPMALYLATLEQDEMSESMKLACKAVLCELLLFRRQPDEQHFFCIADTPDHGISLILDESWLALFPEGALAVCPVPWKAIKLCGKNFAFDAVGVVNAMSAPYRSKVSLLNLSTFDTNFTLVPEDDTECSMELIRKTLHCL